MNADRLVLIDDGVGPDASPCVSVIIPNYNCSRWLKQTIDSCIRQGPHLLEVIVVDDQSTDSSWDVLREAQSEYAEILRFLPNPEKGANNARNLGFTASRGEFIQWLDADDQLLEGKFSSQLAAFFRDPSADVVYSDFFVDTYHHEIGSLIGREEKKKNSSEDFVLDIVRDRWSPPNNYLFRRGIVKRLHDINAWMPDRPVAQDREYVTIAALLGAKFVYEPGTYCVYNRWSAKSTSSLPFQERLKHQIVLEDRFRALIAKCDWSLFRKRQLNAALNAHAINACYYNPALRLRHCFWPWNIDLSLIHWKKRPFVPFIYALQMGQLAISRVLTSPRD